MIQFKDPEWFTEDLQAVAETASRFAERECVPNVSRWRAQRRGDRDIWNRAAGAGLLCASIPEQYGGGGGNFGHEVAILQSLSWSMAGGFSNGVHSGIVAHYILRYGTEEQKQRWLPRMARGEFVAAIAMTEPGCGTDLQAVRTTARLEGDNYIVNGAKTFITNGWHADLICLVCRTGPEEGSKGISLVMAEVGSDSISSPGYRRGQLLDKVGQHTIDTCELFFDNMRVPRQNLLAGC